MASKEQVWRKAILKWKAKLWLRHWQIDIEVRDADDPPSHMSQDAWQQVIASALPLSQYRKAVVYGNRQALGREHPTKLEANACHEVLHIALSPYRTWLNAVMKDSQIAHDWWEAVDEEVTTHLSSVLLSLEESDG